MAAVQDAIQAIGDLQKLTVDIIDIAKTGIGFSMFGLVIKAVNDASPLIADIARLVPEFSDLKQSGTSDYRDLCHAAVELIFAVAAAVAA